jgi:putative heme-binding domain-containing protein
MKRFLILSLLSFLCAFTHVHAADYVVYEGKSGPGVGKHIVFLTGDEEYRSEESFPQLAKILAERHGFKCTVLFAVNPTNGLIEPNLKNSLPGAEALDSADAVVMLLRFREWPDADMKHFVDAYLAGKPIIALRTSTHAFNYGNGSQSPYAKFSFNSKVWPGGFGKQVLGETWIAHHGAHKKEATRGVIEASAQNDPILRGVTDLFGNADVYTATPPPDAKILVRGQVLTGMNPTDPPVEGKKNDPMQPVVWTRLYQNEAGATNKVLCTTMGAATDLQNEGLRRLVVNAVYWGVGLDIPEKADVNYIGEYKPSMYGFDGYTKGVKPADLEHKVKASADRRKKSNDLGGAKGDDLLKPQPRPLRPALTSSQIPLEFIKTERIALVGNSLAERMNLYGHFESLLHSRFSKQELVVRNFGRPADEVANRQRSSDYTKLDDPISAFGPDTFLCFFGYNESFAGPQGVAKFKTDYEKFLQEYAKKYPRDDSGALPRFVLISPAAFESAGDPLLPDAKAENANLKLYTAAVAEVAAKHGLAFVDVFTPTEGLFAHKAGLQYTINGCHLNEAGDREVSQLLDFKLFGGSNPAKIGSPKFEQLRAAVNDKSWIHRQDYRMINGWYVYGGRRTYDTETFPREFLKIRAMAAVRDRYIWDIAQEKEMIPAQPDDSNTGELYTPQTMFGARTYSEPKELHYLTPEESIAEMHVPDGFEVKLFASDREFPELAKPVQLNFDSKGRLWVACMPTYPQWKPGDGRPSDRLLILEDTDGDGKADKCTTFYNKLQCPVGFEFWHGGVLVVDQPHILFLKDSKGGDKADVAEQWTDGWATDDTHHCVNAWEWSPGGLLHMLEGVNMSTTVETPWGPFRNHGSPGAYVIDPRTMKLRHFVTPGYGNPWCYVYNWWGQGIVGDGTSAQQHWDSPLSGAQFNGRRGLNTVFNNEGMRPVVGSEFLYSRQFPDEVQGQFIYACVINMNGLTRFEIHDNGSGYAGTRLKKTVKDAEGHAKQVPDDFLVSTDRNFRPTDPQFGPDGALYFGDWCNALIGHMQYSQRDPNRDHTRGRIYRMTYKAKPLLKPVTQFGKSVPELLDQFKEYEPRTRYRARRELWDRPTTQVGAAVKNWVAKLDPNDKEYDRLLLEALWLQQSHHIVDAGFLKKVLRAKTGEVRAGATHVLADEWDRIPNAMELIKPQVCDEFPRTRLEAVRALSFVQTKESVETALLAADYPLDYWLEYTLQMTLGALESVWQEELKAGTIARSNPKGLAFLETTAVGSKPGEAADRVIKRLLRGGMSDPDRRRAYGSLAEMNGGADNGKAIFNRICVACHMIDGQGVEYGPDLSKVGSRLSAADIVESIMDPNAKVDPKYTTTNVETKDGEAYTGFTLNETDDALTLRIAGGKSLVLKKTEISKRENLKQSSMPEGLAGGMSATEFLDIVTYLNERKETKP